MNGSNKYTILKFIIKNMYLKIMYILIKIISIHASIANKIFTQI
jgi:hypothetical protein